MTNNENEIAKAIMTFLVAFAIICLLVLILLFLLDTSWGFKTLILGVCLIFLSIFITFFKIILMQKYNLINPGGKELLGIVFILIISGVIFIFIALLNLMNVLL